MSDVADLLAELRRAPLSRADALIRALGLRSQSALSRLVTRAGAQVVPVGKARARRYAAARDVRGLGAALPVYRVDTEGALTAIAALAPIAPEGCVVDDAKALPRWMRGTAGDGVFGGLPVFVADLRPQGFLGRTFARTHAGLGLADNPDQWPDDDVLVALARAGEDGVGDLVVGQESARRLYALRAEAPPPIADPQRPAAYAGLATAAIDGVLPGSSAGGEQPKFGALVAGASGPRHVLVKFSPEGDAPAAQRWRDLLVCEHLALSTLRAAGFPTVHSALVAGPSRLFLESERFDRVGAHGRIAVVTLAAMNGEYAGVAPAAGHWPEAAAKLAADGWLLPATLAQVRALHWFGRFIANTDMHFGNLSFLPQVDGTLALAPVYDMLPMVYAPVGAELPPRRFAVPVPEPGQESAWSAAGELAVSYWTDVAGEPRLSRAIRATATENAATVHAALTRFPVAGAVAN